MPPEMPACKGDWWGQRCVHDVRTSVRAWGETEHGSHAASMASSSFTVSSWRCHQRGGGYFNSLCPLRQEEEEEPATVATLHSAVRFAFTLFGHGSHNPKNIGRCHICCYFPWFSKEDPSCTEAGYLCEFLLYTFLYYLAFSFPAEFSFL